VKWSGTLPAGTKYEHPVVSLDIMATALGIAGLKPAEGQPLDGVNLIPYLKGESTAPPHETLYWRFIQHRAIRHRNWKLTMPSNESPGLFDLSSDISESNDVSAAHPEMVDELKKRHAAWEAQMPPVSPVPRPRPVQN
ncbi:MAG TPA: sulfatase, partial [Caulifigura sp.]|nr:sulfatase [Caulifigura sp.]